MKRQFITFFLLTGLLLSLCACGASNAASSAASSSLPAPSAAPQEEVESTVSSVAEEYAASSAEDSAEPEHSEVEPENSEPDVMRVLESQWEEPSVADLYAEVADQFRQMEYTDEETGLTIPYNLYVPEGSTDEAYPMVVFISDSTSVGQDLSAPLTQGYGGIIWASEHEQAKHKSFVLVPEYPEIIIDDNNGTQITDYVDATARMIQRVAEENGVDMNRIYGTGQSMGCMTFLYLAANYPDLLAAELFVSGQWQVDELPELGSQTFFYIAAGGDLKASQGQADVLAMLEAQGIPVSTSYEWDANWDDAAYAAVLRPMLEEGNNINIGQFAAGTVLEANPRGIEHMSSFDCAYRIDAVRDWLFLQHK